MILKYQFPQRVHRARQHAAGDVFGFESVLQQDARRVVGALGGTADDMDLAVAGKLAEARAELRQRDVDRARHALHDQFHRLAHVQEEAPSSESQ